MKKIITLLFAFALSIPMWAATYTTYLAVYPEGAGYVGLAANPTTTTETATTTSNYGTKNIYAKAATGYVFLGWGSTSSATSYISTDSPYSLKCYSYNNKTIYAIFKPEDKTATVYQAGTGAGTTYYVSIPSDVVDLDLPSGVLWCTADLSGYYKWGTNTAATSYGSTGFTYSTTWSSDPCSTKGTGYRLPTKTEVEELLNTSNTTTSVSSYVLTVKSKTDANKQIKFTKEGYYTTSKSTTYTWFWTSTYKSGTGNSATAYGLQVGQNYSSSGNTTEYYACKIRPVYSSPFKVLTVNVGSYKYVYKCIPGQKVTITASASSGNKFNGWTGGYTGSDATHDFTVSSNITVTANFVADGYTVTMANDGNGSSSATVGGTTTTAAAGQTSNTGKATSVNLSCSASEGYEFDYWTKDGTTQSSWSATQNSVAISANCTIQACFKKKKYAISASVAQDCTGWGTVTGGGTYEHGAPVTLTATATDAGYNFEKWNDGTNDFTTNPLVFDASEAKTYTAYFASASQTYSITATKNIDAAGTVTVTNGTDVTSGTEATLTAETNAGYRFVKWTSNGVDYTTTPLQVEVSTNATYQAVYEALATRNSTIYQDIAQNGKNEDYTFGNANYYTLTIIGNGKNTYKCLPGQQVTIDVYHEADWNFQKWNDDNTSATRTFTVTADATYRAIFVSAPSTSASGGTPATPSHDVKIYQDNNSNGETKSYAAQQTVDGAVDLGLSVLWATKNVGASSSTDVGGYYSWGEITTKADYSTTSYTDNPAVLPSDHDVATAILGGNWRLPTKAEFEELRDNCDKTWQSTGTKGWNVTSRVDSKKSIFLPSGGAKTGSTGAASLTNNGYYWTSTWHDATNAKIAKLMESSYWSITYDSRHNGCNVRAVCPAPARYTLTVKSMNGTTVGAKVNKYTFDDNNNTVTIYAMPKSDGSRFVKWSDNSTENPRTFTVTESQEITAEFTPYVGTIAAAGDWNTAATWTNSIMPSKTTDVTIGSAVTVGDAVDNKEVFQAIANAKNITANAALTVKNGAYLTVAGTLTVANTVTLAAGSTTKISGLTINNGGTLVIEDGAIVTLPATITNNGTITYNSDISFTTANVNGGTFNGTGTLTITTLNQSGDLTANRDITVTTLNQSAGTISGTGAVSATTVNYSGGTLSSNLTAGTLVNNATLDINSDFATTVSTELTNNSSKTLTISKDYTIATLTNNGTMTIANGATLAVTTMTGAGAVTNNGTLSINGNYTAATGLDNNGTLNVTGDFAAGAAYTNDATVTATGNITATTLTMTSGSMSATNITATTLNYNGGTLTGNVTATELVNGTDLTINSSNKDWNITTLTNSAEKTLTIADGTKFTVGTLNATAGVTTIEAGATLKVTTAISTTDETNLVLKSNATANAYLVLPTEGTVQPYGTVELYTVAKSKTQWQHMGIPTVGQPTITSPAGVSTWVNEWSTDGEKDGTWKKIASVSDFSTPFKGYNLTNNAASAGSVYSFAGQLFGNASTGDMSFVKDFFQPYANSYTAPIAASAILSSLSESAEATLWIYDPVHGSSDNYTTVTLTSNNTTKILPMQAFFLKGIEDDALSSQSYGALLSDPTAQSAPRRGSSFREVDYTATANITISSATMSDEVILKESEELTNKMDRHYDASKMLMNGKMQVYAMGSENKQAILATDVLDGTYLGFNAGAESEYTIRFTNVEGSELILRDLVSGVEMQVKEGSEYTFQATPNSTNTHRFVVVGPRFVTTDVENTEVETTATKLIENGEVIILRDGNRYNVLGAEK